jgi:hypothetical protein
MRASNLPLPPERERAVLKMATAVFSETLENLYIQRGLFPKADIIH